MVHVEQKVSGNINHSIDYSKIPTFRTCGTSEFQGALEFVRTAEAKIDFVFPEVVFPTNKLYRLWGEKNIRDMVFYHHRLLRKSSIGSFFSSDDAVFEFATKKTGDFFVEALGGGKVYSSQYGHPALRMRHFHMTIDEKAREIWLMMYKKTIKELSMPAECIEEFWNWIEALSIRMINRRTTVLDIQRFPFTDMFKEPIAQKKESN
ncbi:globin [bacterium]|nr:globin [bacterium]MBU1883543.1 globin [bacterium]